MSSEAHDLEEALPAPRAPLPTAVDEFLASMPPSYHQQFDENDARDHAAVAWRRGNGVAHLERWGETSQGESWLCLVTDDRPGLLAMLSAAITAHGLTVVDAKIYCHAGFEGRAEVLDLFRVSRVNGNVGSPLSDQELAALQETVIGVLKGRIEVRSLLKKASPTWRPAPRSQNGVRFDISIDGPDRLLIETDDRRGLLASVTAALFELGLRITWSDVATTGGRVRDLFHLVEPDGGKLSPERKVAVVTKVSNAIQRLEPALQPYADDDSEDSLTIDRLSQIQMHEPVPAPPPRRFSKPV